MPFNVAGGNHCHIKLTSGLCMLSGHLLCSLLSMTYLFTCVLRSRAFLSWLPLWNPILFNFAKVSANYANNMHLATCASSLFCYLSYSDNKFLYKTPIPRECNYFCNLHCFQPISC